MPDIYDLIYPPHFHPLRPSYHPYSFRGGPRNLRSTKYQSNTRGIHATSRPGLLLGYNDTISALLCGCSIALHFFFALLTIQALVKYI